MTKTLKDLIKENAKLQARIKRLEQERNENVVAANCCQCGRIVDTREENEGGDPFGCQIESGKWACSFECYCKETGQPSPSPMEK